MTDVVIPLGTGSRHDNMELRYCLRSIEKHLTDLGRVFVVGEYPDWLRKAWHIPYTEKNRGRDKEANICNKVLAACAYPDLSDQFLFFNDDHYLLTPTTGPSFPLHHKGALQTAFTKARQNPYRYSLRSTITVLKTNHLPLYNFDTHSPILYDKKLFPAIMRRYDWTRPFGYVIKSLYANSLRLSGTEYPDLKFIWDWPIEQIEQAVKDRPYFSIGDGGINDAMRQFLEQTYPEPSSFEVAVANTDFFATEEDSGNKNPYFSAIPLK